MRPQPTPEFITEMVEEAKALGDVPYNQNGTITFDFFVETSKIITKYIHNYSKVGMEEDKVKRREFVATGKEQEFTKLVRDNLAW